jgi:predicted  nucleic acid-binding Zn-ribbon protein
MTFRKPHYFNSLKKSLKVSLRDNPKVYRIALSRIDDIEEKINQGWLSEFVEEEYDKAREAIVKARDIVRFDMSDSYAEAEGLLDDLVSTIDELGLDTPQEVANLRNNLFDLQEEIDDWERKIEQFWN